MCDFSGSRAKERFSRLYPDHDPDQSLADFAHWLAKGHTANKPDAAFLGSAKKRVARG